MVLFRQPDLEKPWRKSREWPCGVHELVRKYRVFGPLVVDERLLDKTDTEFRSMPLELMEPRYGIASAGFCVQFKKKD